MIDSIADLAPGTLLAVVGLDRLFAEKDRILVSDKERAEMLPREIRRACQRFVQGEPLSGKLPRRGPFDYQRSLDWLTQAMDSENEDEGASGRVSQAFLERIGARFRDDDSRIAAGFLADVQRVVPYLQSIVPIRTETTMAKTINIDPSDTEIAAFRRAWDIASDPMIILRDLEAGVLSPDQVPHFAALYPPLYSATKTQMGLAFADAQARKKSWRLPYDHERQVAVLYGTDTMTPALSAELQKSFAAAGSSGAPAGGKGQPKGAPSKAGKTASLFQPQTSATADRDLAKAGA